jgi:hypothetical protein
MLSLVCSLLLLSLDCLVREENINQGTDQEKREIRKGKEENTKGTTATGCHGVSDRRYHNNCGEASQVGLTYSNYSHTFLERPWIRPLAPHASCILGFGLEPCVTSTLSQKTSDDRVVTLEENAIIRLLRHTATRFSLPLRSLSFPNAALVSILFSLLPRTTSTKAIRHQKEFCISNNF